MPQPWICSEGGEEPWSHPKALSPASVPRHPQETSLDSCTKSNRYLLDCLFTGEDGRPPWGGIDSTFQQYPSVLMKFSYLHTPRVSTSLTALSAGAPDSRLLTPARHPQPTHTAAGMPAPKHRLQFVRHFFKSGFYRSLLLQVMAHMASILGYCQL